MRKLEITDLSALKLADLERAAQRAVFLGLHRTPGFQLVTFLRSRNARRYEQRINGRWCSEHARIVERLVGRAAIDLGLEREKTQSIERLQALEAVELLAAMPEEELALKVSELGEAAQSGLSLVLQAARLGVNP